MNHSFKSAYQISGNIGLFVILIALSLSACNTSNNKGEASVKNVENQVAPTKDKNTVVIHSLADPDRLNPMNYNSATSGYMLRFMFQTLLSIDFKELEYVPQLAVARPEVAATPDGKMTIGYEIRPEATWDDGSPITAADVEFTLKVFRNPHVDCDRIRPYYEFIEEVQIDKDNPKKFTFVCKEPYMIAEASSGDIYILSSKIYDKKGLMSSYTLKEMQKQPDKVKNDPKMVEFAQEFNSEKYQRETVVGSGPYTFDRWETNQRVVLKRKKDWWGDKVENGNMTFDAFPEELTYETVNDLATAVVALKGGKLDVMNNIPPKDFVKDLPKSEKYTSQFNSYTPPYMAYDYIAFNLKNPKFTDHKVRKAFAHLMDVDKLIKTKCYGLGERTLSFLHPTNKFYNKELIPYDFNVEEAKKLLQEAGWEDTNGNGTLDKMLDGRSTEFEVELAYNSGNDRRESACLILQEAARKAGIKINIVTKEASVHFEDLKKHKFEMGVAGWVASVVESDPKQIWHSESANGGSNFTYFGNAQSDKVIDNLRKELDENKRGELYKELQKLVYDDIPYIFLLAQKERIAIHKAFVDPTVSAMRPGFFAGGLKLATTEMAAQ